MFKKMIISILISTFLITFVEPIIADSTDVTENNRIIYSITEEEMLELYPEICAMTINVYEDGTMQIFIKSDDRGSGFEYDSRKICFDKVRFCKPEEPWWRIGGAGYSNSDYLPSLFLELTKNSTFPAHLTEYILNSENCPSEEIGQYESENVPICLHTYNSYTLPVETSVIWTNYCGRDYTGIEILFHIKEEYLSENPVIMLFWRDPADGSYVFTDSENDIKFEIPISNPPKDKDTYIQELEDRITELENKIIELESQIPVSTNVGDVDNDGFIDSTDATWILSYYAYIMTGGDPTVTITNFVSKTQKEEPSI